MGSKIKKELAKARFDKTLKEWKYLKGLEKDTKHLLGLYDADLSEVISELHQYSIKGVDIEAQEKIRDQKEKEEKEEQERRRASLTDEELQEEESEFDSKSAKSENSEIPGWVKKLYKKLALETHPDKISRMNLEEKDKARREEIFKQASSFLDSKDYDSLIEFAGELGIDFEIEDESQTRIIKNSLNKISDSINSLKNQTAWRWGESEEIDQQLSYLNFVRKELSLEKIPHEIIREYLVCREKGEIKVWMDKHVNCEQENLKNDSFEQNTPANNNIKDQPKILSRSERGIPESRKPGDRPNFKSRRK